MFVMLAHFTRVCDPSVSPAPRLPPCPAPGAAAPWPCLHCWPAGASCQPQLRVEQHFTRTRQFPQEPLPVHSGAAQGRLLHPQKRPGGELAAEGRCCGEAAAAVRHLLWFVIPEDGKAPRSCPVSSASQAPALPFPGLLCSHLQFNQANPGA